MAQLTWEALNPIDTSKYLDAIQKAQAQTVAGVEQIGNAYKGYQDNLMKQNTNEMLTALNQAQNPEELAIAQANIAAMQQRWGTGYDMDAVRTAMDERPTTLMQRQTTEMDFQDKQANRAARPEASAIRMAQLKALNATEEQLASIKAMDAMGADSAAIAESLGQHLTNDQKFKFDKEWKEKDYNQKDKHHTDNLNQRKHEFNETNDRANRESAWGMGKDAYNAEQQGAGTVHVAADGTEFTTGGGGGASIARYASMFGPLAAGMIRTESNGNTNAVSPKGAQGIIQIMPATAADPGYGMSPIDLKNSTPEEQIRWGMEYRSRLQKHHGFTEDQATAAFNAGGGAVEKAVKKAKNSGGNWLSYLPKETRDYVPRVNKATAQYANGGSGPVGNTPMVGIDRKVQQKIRGDYQNAMLKYNEELALKDQPVNVGNVLAGLTAKEKGSKVSQDAFDIVNALKDNEQLKGLSAEGITNVYNRAKNWQSRPGAFFEVYNSAAGLKGSINNFIKDEIGIEAQRKKHVAKASHPSNLYVQQIQQAFEAQGVSISAKEALLHVDPDRYEALYGTPTVKVQEALDNKVDKVEAAAPTKAAPAAASKPTPKASSQAFIPYAKLGATPVTSMTPKAVGTPAKPTPKASPAKAATKPTKQDIVNYYVKKGNVTNLIPEGLDHKKDGQLIAQARGEARKVLLENQKAKAAKARKDAEAAKAKKAAEKIAREARDRAELARVRKEHSENRKQREAKQQIKAAAEKAAHNKKVDMSQMYKTHQQQKAKEEEERKRKNK